MNTEETNSDTKSSTSKNDVTIDNLNDNLNIDTVINNSFKTNTNKTNTDKEKKETQKNDDEKEKTSKKNDDKKENAPKNTTENLPNKDTSKKYISKEEKSLLRFMIFAFIFSIYFVIFSTIFALLNTLNNDKIAKGVYIKGINVSNLTIDEAKEKMNKALNIELNGNLDLTYKDEIINEIEISEIKYKYNIDSAIQKAFEIGKSSNLLIDNYKLLYSLFLGIDIDISYSYNDEILDEIAKNTVSSIPGLITQPSYYIEDDELIITKGSAGLDVDLIDLQTNILDSIYNRNVYKILENQILTDSLEIKANYTKPNKIDLAYIYEEVKCEPQDAYYIAEPFEIKPEQDGIDFAISIKEAQKIVDNEDLEEYSIPLIITPASLTIDDIGVEAFPYKISTFSTKYDASNTNRTENLKLAANKINGKVLMPGDKFSFNEIVGKRTIEDGYKNALIYENGQVVNGLAGGICQISSTLYNATLLANLEITERYNHSYTSTYVPAGRDATVVYGAKDFKFTNTRNYPIKLEASVEKGTATFTIYGVEEAEEYDIKIYSTTTSVIPYNVIYTPDPTLAPGQQKVTQAGHSGYKVTTYIEKSLNGKVISKDVISNDTYKAMNTLINVGQ